MASAEERQAKAMEQVANNTKELAKVLTAINTNLVVLVRQLILATEKMHIIAVASETPEKPKEPIIEVGDRVQVIVSGSMNYGRNGTVTKISGLDPEAVLVSFKGWDVQSSDERYYIRKNLSLVAKKIPADLKEEDPNVS